ncbi:MAG: type-F conjugative transfer system pilin assembly protein TrbC [Gammaproteobacteria bacterium]|nr:type-F conjugative transfer system pilin assembly protein TrbC [Gammaproteobacteria bacterium]
MCYKILWIFLSLLLVDPVLAEGCHACSSETYSPELYARHPENASSILVFISFSMPEQSLKLWAEQASQIKAPLILGGFVENSIFKTTQKAFELFGNDTLPELLVDPEAFERFGIQVVPAVVAVSDTESSTNHHTASEKQPHFEVVYGDTSLLDALRLMQSRGSEAIKKVVTPFFAILRTTELLRTMDD